jgi:hypothetical protein
MIVQAELYGITMMDDTGPTDAEKIVQRQLDAYNLRNIDAFMAMWSPDAQYFKHPSKLLASGAVQIRKRHITRFKDPNLYGRLIKRIAVGNKVVDQEIVSRTFPEGPGRIGVIAIYEVNDDTIAKAWFIFGSPILDAKV